MNKTLSFAVAGIALITVGACTSTKSAPATISDLTGEWNIIQVDGNNVVIPQDQEAPYIAFDTQNGQVSGSASCNRIMGVFDPKAASGVIDLSNMASTRMMCPDMALEDSIFGALSKVNAYRLSSDGNIELCHGDTTLLLLQKREPSVSANQLSGTWNIKELNGLILKNDSTEEYQMTFDPSDSSFSCTTGCNNVNGSYSSDLTDMTFHSMMSTRMACPDMTVEDSLNSILPRISSFGILAGGGAGFYDNEQNMILLLER